MLLVSRRLQLCVLLILFCVAAASRMVGTDVFIDPFQRGESFTSLQNVTLGKPFLTIHGAMDYIPALLARKIWGANNYFLPTFFVHKIFHLLAAGLFVLTCLFLARGEQFFALILISFIAPFLLSEKSLLLLASLGLCLFLRFKKLRLWTDFILRIILAFFLAFGMFWSFDRGIAGIIAICTAMVLCRESWKDIFFPIMVFIAAAVLTTSHYFSIKDYLGNLVVLFKTASQWSYKWNVETLKLTVFVVTVNIFAIIALGIETFHKRPEKNDIFKFILFSLLAFFMLKAAVNRADASHVQLSMWVPLVITLLFHQHKLYGKVIFVSVVVFYILFVFPNFVKGDFRWLSHLGVPPSNYSVSPIGVQWVANKISQSGATCLIDLSNSGLINGLTALPSCSRFTYPVYANSQYEEELIKAYASFLPPTIVFSSDGYQYCIDGKSMIDRFPKLNVFLAKQYPIQECNLGYCIRHKK